MRLTKSASGKTTVKMSKSEWTNIGKKAGWIAEVSNNCKFSHMTPKFNPVTRENQEETAKFIKTIFPDEGGEHGRIDRSVRRSVDPHKRPGDGRYEELVAHTKYYRWTDPADENKMIGSSGLYRLKEHPEDEIWIDWFGVSSDQRGNGAGVSILNQTIEMARNFKNTDGTPKYKKIKLWTHIPEGDFQIVKQALDTGIWPDKNSINKLSPEGVAQKIYYNAGFKVIGRSISNGIYELIWEKELNR